MRESGMGREAIATELGVSIKKVKRELEIYRAILKEKESPEVQLETDVARVAVEQQIRYWKSKCDKLTKRAALDDRLIAAARECITAFPTPPPKYPTYVPPIKKVKHGVLCRSDLHGGETILPEETLNIGNFNKHILARRLEYLTDSFLNLTDTQKCTANVSKAWILDQGDMVTGWIHKELEKHADLDIMGQVFLVAYLLAQSDYEIAQEYDEVEIVGVPGNHGRFTDKPEHKRAWQGWDYVVYQLRALFLRNVTNIKFTIPKSRFAIVNINGWNYFVSHGDVGKGDPKQKALLISDMLAYTDQKVDGFFLAHLHDAVIKQELNYQVVVNGTLAGASDFGIGKLTLACRPMQFVGFVDKEVGLAERCPVFLDNIPSPDMPTRYSIDEPNVWAERVIH
jgi:hypothetical protein